MKLNKEQIIQIRDYISRRGFTYYDLQLEIIDHVACRVEELMTANDKLTLDEAIFQSHAEFGPLGFSAFEDAMRTSLKQKHWRLFRDAYAKYFGWKYLPLMIGFVMLFYYISIIINKPDLLTGVVWIGTFLGFLVYMISNYNQYKGKKQMLYAELNSTSVIMLNAPIQLFNLMNIFVNRKESLSAGLTGIILGVLIVLIVTGLHTLHEVAEITKQQSLDLEMQYMQTVG